MTVVTRFAPSPTGLLHIGGVRTALYAWAFARKNKGKFVLRVEDTDTVRSTKTSADAILDAMAWLGLDYDVGPVYQMDRLPFYQSLVDKLLQSGLAFKCYDNRGDLDINGTKNRAVYRSPWRNGDVGGTAQNADFMVRFKVPDSGTVAFHDAVKGLITVDVSTLEDFALMRSNGVPMYNFAAVADDMDMGITHVIRGDDHVNNTPKQILIYQALGAAIPTFAHLPMILDQDGKKLSKRNQSGTNGPAFPTDVGAVRDLGITPSALLNYLARLGWAHGDDEVFDVDTFIKWFDLDAVQAAPARVNVDKLHWLNAQHLKNMPFSHFLTWSLQQPNVVDSDHFRKSLVDVFDVIKSRCNDTLSFRQDVVSFSTLCDAPPVVKNGVIAALDPAVQDAWARFSNALPLVTWTYQDLDTLMRKAATDAGCKFGPFATSLRKAMTDQPTSPPLPMSFLAMGRPYAIKWVTSAMSPDEGVPTPF